MTVDVLCPNVFDAGLPSLVYDFKDTPADVYPRIRQAQAQAPIAIDPFGPEIISHELARTVLRDPRFTIPPGMNLMVQGITSGPLWDKIVKVSSAWMASRTADCAAWSPRRSHPGPVRACTTPSSR